MKRVSAVGLTAGILGFYVSPLFYLAMGSPFRLPAGLGIGLAAVTLASSGFLLARNLARPGRFPSTLSLLGLEALAMLGVVLSLSLSAHAVFIASSRRMPFAISVISSAWALCLPLPMLRKTTLEWRISLLPSWLTTGVLVTLITAAAFFVFRFLSEPEHLI